MKLITFRLPSGEIRAGWIHQETYAVDMNVISNGVLPKTMHEFIHDFPLLKPLLNQWEEVSAKDQGVYSLQDVSLLAPIPNPLSIRDFYAFEQHVKTARAKRGLDVVSEWYDFPVFYFTNHLAVTGPGSKIEIPPGCNSLDYELEIACVIGKEGRNISAQEAEDYILGFCIMNDWSARNLQKEEMKVGLGPAKGKDFATTLGPCIATLDEFSAVKDGQHYNLTMAAHVNGKQLSSGNVKDLYYSFGEMIERASKGVTLYPGEVIGSGTVGTGCILELGTDVHRWLQEGDQVTLFIEGLGMLTNTIGSESR